MKVGPRKKAALGALLAGVAVLATGVVTGVVQWESALLAAGVAVLGIGIAFADVRQGRRARRLEMNLHKTQASLRNIRSELRRLAGAVEGGRSEAVAAMSKTAATLSEDVEELRVYLDDRLDGIEERYSRALLARMFRVEAAFDERADTVDAELERMGARLRTAQADERRIGVRLAEASLALQAELPAGSALPPFGRWAASSDLLLYLYRLILALRPEIVLECGSGVSSAVMGSAASVAGSRVVSLEHEERFVAKTRFWCEQAGVSDIVDIVHAPLIDTSIDGEVYGWYDTSGLPALPRAQLLFVDGPPGRTNPRARFPAVPALLDLLAEEVVVVLDDASRPDEAEMLDEWIGFLPSHELIELRHEKGTGVLAPSGSVAALLE